MDGTGVVEPDWDGGTCILLGSMIKVRRHQSLITPPFTTPPRWHDSPVAYTIEGQEAPAAAAAAAAAAGSEEGGA